jgi:hypothetical protein
MVGALWRSPLVFNVHVIVEKTDAWAGSDTITVEATADTTVSKTLKLNDGQAGDATMLAHMVYDPGKLDTGSTVTIKVNGQATPVEFPFAAKNWKVTSGKSGSYTVDVQLR